MITYYITGLTGFVGKNVLLQLEKTSDFHIVTLVLPHEKEVEFINKPYITIVVGNILNKEDVLKFVSTPGEGDKVLLHIAGRVTTLKRGDQLTMDINFNGTKNIVDSVNEVGDYKKLVYVSSVDAMERIKDGEIKEVSYYEVDKAVGVYSKSKALSNNYIIKNAKVNSSIVLPSAIMGSDDPNAAPINVAIKKYLNHKLPAITKGGYNIVDVKDVARGILNAVSLGRDKESYFLTGQYISVKDLIGLAAEINNSKPVKLIVPHFLIKMISPLVTLNAKIHAKTPLFTGFSMDCLKQNSNYSYKKAHDKLHYEPTDLKSSMKETISWMKESGYLDK